MVEDRLAGNERLLGLACLFLLGLVLAARGPGVEPYPDAPPCSAHDPTAWHGLWDEVAGCHYDHHHGASPADALPSLQPLVADWGVSSPWQTPMENEHKHAGYINLVTRAAGTCEQAGAATAPNCVRAVFVQVHSMGTNHEMLTRHHSYRVAAHICNPSGTQCGHLESGGWSDYGTLHSPYKETHCRLENDPLYPEGLPPDVSTDQPPYRAAPPLAEYQQSQRTSQFWNSQQTEANSYYYPNQPNRLAQFAWSFFDGWDIFDCATGRQPNPPGGAHNHSLAQTWTFRFELGAAQWQPYVTAGRVNFNGYLDRNGHVVHDCTQPGVDCVPTLIAGVPFGTALLNREVRRIDPARGDPHDYDVYLDGQSAGWLEYPVVD